MPCFHPLSAWRTKDGAIVFDQRFGVGFGFHLPCGQCRGCRLERSRQWAMRCVHEASLFEENCFITLTYSDECLPSDGSLNKKHFQDFMKRLRSRVVGRRIRYFHAGEYGSKYRRPHYHACLFNFDFADKKLFRRVNGLSLYISDLLDSVWNLGFCTVGSLTFESAAYVARYIMKKVTGDVAAEHYLGCDDFTGALTELEPEYVTMSRGGRGGLGGIGREWYKKFSGDVFPGDDVVLRGRRMRPPRYYDCMYELENPDDFARIKAERVRASHRGAADCTPERLAVRERVSELEAARYVERGDYEA